MHLGSMGRWIKCSSFFFDASLIWFLNPTSCRVIASLMLSPILLSLKTENTQFRMNRLITLFCFSWLIRTANCQTTSCSFFGCWLTPLHRILVSLSHHPKASPAWLFCRASRLFVFAHTSSGWGCSRESCSGPFHAWQCERWPPCPCFLE
jgi:hypothetical protein